MQRILRISLLTCCVPGDTTGIQPALELCWKLGQSPLLTNSAALLPSGESAPQPQCWIYAAKNLGWLHCSLACQECPLLVYKPVVVWESELSFCRFPMADVLHSLSCLSTQTLFSILLSSALRLGAQASDRAGERKDWNYFFQAVHNKAVALSTPGL